MNLVRDLKRHRGFARGLEVANSRTAGIIENQIDDSSQRQAEVFASEGIDERGFQRRFDGQRLRLLVVDVGQVSLHQSGRLLFQLRTFVVGFETQICCGHRFVPAIGKTLHNVVRVQSDAELAVSVMHL